MINYLRSSRFKKASTWVLLMAFVSCLGLPTLAFSRPPSIADGSGEIADNCNSGDPVGGERKDEKIPVGGDVRIHEELIQGDFSWKAGSSRSEVYKVRMPVLVPWLTGIWGGATLVIILNPFLRGGGDGR